MAGYIDRALIIRRSLQLSQEYAQGCADSCNLNSLPYEFVEGVEFMTSEEAYASVGIQKNENLKSTQGHDNACASHIKAWRRIIEIDKPCLILEHDSLVKGTVTNIEIPDNAAVTFGFRVGNPKFYEPPREIENLVAITKSIGLHAYAITPSTAKLLVERLETDGVSHNLDRYIMVDAQSGLNLYVPNPPQVICWPRSSTREWQDPDKEVREASATWNFQESVPSGWTDGWDINRT